jgi:hypothetical protein
MREWRGWVILRPALKVGWVERAGKEGGREMGRGGRRLARSWVVMYGGKRVGRDLIGRYGALCPPLSRSYA